jgi:hypothetical protein
MAPGSYFPPPGESSNGYEPWEPAISPALQREAK